VSVSVSTCVLVMTGSRPHSSGSGGVVDRNKDLVAMFQVRLAQIAEAITFGLNGVADELKGLKSDLRKRKIAPRVDAAAYEDDDEDVRFGVASCVFLWFCVFVHPCVVYFHHVMCRRCFCCCRFIHRMCELVDESQVLLDSDDGVKSNKKPKGKAAPQSGIAAKGSKKAAAVAVAKAGRGKATKDSHHDESAGEE
jgi:hypothetical protein